MSTERTLYKYLVWPMRFSLRQANLFMCKARAISRRRRAAGYWNNIPGPEVRLLSQKLPARLASTLCYYLACKFFAAAKRAPWAEHHQSCYSFIIKRTHLPDDPTYFINRIKQKGKGLFRPLLFIKRYLASNSYFVITETRFL